MMNKFLFLKSLTLLILIASCSQTPPETPTPLPPAPTSLPDDPQAASPSTITPSATATVAGSELEVPATTTPTPPADEGAANDPLPEQNGTTVAYNGIYLFVDEALATEVFGESFPADDSGVSGPWWGNRPAYDRISLQGYPVEDEFQTPQIEVYPLREAASRNVYAADQIEQLQGIIDGQTADFPEKQILPLLPLINAAQVLSVQEEIIPFTNGSGLRYLTAYAQDVYPVTNTDIFYTYQGITSDGQYYISFILPLRTDALPDEVTMDEDEYLRFIEGVDAYLTDTAMTLNNLTAADFQPDLDSLDALVSSLEIDRDSALPPTEEPLAITYPVDNGQVRIGDTLEVSGYARPGGSETVEVILTAGTNILGRETVQVDENGIWSVILQVPINVVGQGQIRATNADNQITNRIQFRENPTLISTENDPAITFFAPGPGSTAVAGYPLYFAGTVTNPLENAVSIGVLTDDCTTWAAQQRFTVEGNADWQGVIYLPSGSVDDRACAVAYTGTYGQGDWREMQTIIPILPPDDPAATRIFLNSPFGLNFQPGEVAVISGAAVNAPEVQVTMKDSAAGTILAEGTTTTGDFGLWEIQLPVPEDSPDFFDVEITLVEEAEGEPYKLITYATITREQ